MRAELIEALEVTTESALSAMVPQLQQSVDAAEVLPLDFRAFGSELAAAWRKSLQLAELPLKVVVFFPGDKFAGFNSSHFNNCGRLPWRSSLA